MREPTSSDRQNLDWHIHVVCQNESARIGACLTAIRRAVGGRRALVTLTINGSTDDSEAVALSAAAACELPLEVYRIPAADKANALNRFIYDQRQPARMLVFTDGHVVIGPESLEAMDACLASNHHAIAATGHAINGRTMRLASKATLEAGGILHGQLHALRPDFLDRFVAMGLRLPIGTYWGDGLMGSMVCHNLDAVGEAWDNGRIAGVAEATYEITRLSVLRPRDLRRQFRRKIRQMRGRLQNKAVSDIVYRLGYAGLPAEADTMVRSYLAEKGVPPVSILDRPFMMMALQQLRHARPADYASLEPLRTAQAGAAA